LDLASTLRVEEEEEFSYCGYDIEGVKGFLKGLKLGEGWHKLKNVVFEVFFFQITIARGIIERYLNPGLK
jgi:hypothetical protein